MPQIDRAAAMDASFLPDAIRTKYVKSFELARAGIDGAQAVRDADAATEVFLPEYQPLHVDVRRTQATLGKLHGSGSNGWSGIDRGSPTTRPRPMPSATT